MARVTNNQAYHTANRQGSVHASGLVGYSHPGSRACCTFPSVAWGWLHMQQIADWLEKLGMSEYAQRFAENDIDLPSFPI